MPRCVARAIGLALLGLMVASAGAGVAKAHDAIAHACCERPLGDASAAAPMRCDGFLPLSCCDAAALPASETPPPFLAVVLVAFELAPVPIAAPLPLRCAPRAARASPVERSVVLQV